MGSVKRFAAINTKVMALEGKLLKKKDYESLIEQKNVQDLITYLKEHTAYRAVLEEINIYDFRVDELELLFKRHIVKQYEKLIHYFTGPYKKLFKILIKRYEIEDIKLYLRAITRKEDVSHIKDLVVYSGMYSTMDHDQLSRSKDLESFIENLKGKQYYRLLKPYLEEEPNRRLFYMEMVLDRLYFREFADETNKLDVEDRVQLKELLGKNIDLLNLQWIYRGLRFFKVAPEELINYTLPGGFHLNYSKLKALCYSGNEEELINKMIDSKYGFLFDNKATLEIFMERRIERYLYFLLLEYKHREKMNIIEPMVYIHFLEYEMRDIISIIEAIKYKMEPEETKKFLVRKFKGVT